MRLKNLFMALVLISGIVLVFWSGAGRGGNAIPAQPQQSESAAHPIRYLYMDQELKEPKSQVEIEWLRRRKAEQEKRAREYKPFHDFKFVDRLPESGITFKHSVVDDDKKITRPIIMTTAMASLWPTSTATDSTTFIS
jgi:hypothetical protein